PDATFATSTLERTLELQTGNLACNQQRTLDLDQLDVPTAHEPSGSLRNRLLRSGRNPANINGFDEAVDNEKQQWPVIDQALRGHHDANERITGVAIDPLQLGADSVDLSHADLPASNLCDHRLACGSLLRKTVQD